MKMENQHSLMLDSFIVKLNVKNADTLQSLYHLSTVMNNMCNGIFGKIFGHKFVARYDIKPLNIEKNIASEMANTVKHYVDNTDYVGMDDDNITNIMDGFRWIDGVDNEQTYICDVCVRCGEVIKKS